METKILTSELNLGILLHLVDQEVSLSEEYLRKGSLMTFESFNFERVQLSRMALDRIV